MGPFSRRLRPPDRATDPRGSSRFAAPSTPAGPGDRPEHDRPQPYAGYAAPSEPDDEQPAQERDWRETLSAAADFALLGIAVSLASILVLTAGAALATGSAATAHWYRCRSMPPAREMGRTFVRALVPGVLATVVGTLLALLLAADLVLVARGVVPGGPVFLAVGALVATQVLGLASLTLVSVGERGGTGWRASVRWALRAASSSPLTPTTLAVVLALTAAIGVLIPVVSPVMLGFALFAIHVVTRRQVRVEG